MQNWIRWLKKIRLLLDLSDVVRFLSAVSLFIYGEI